MRVLVVEGERNKGPQGLFGPLLFQIQRCFNRANTAVGRLQHGNVEALLAPEVVVDHALAGFGSGGNMVDPRAAEALAGELLRRNIDDVALGPVGIIDALSARLRVMES